MARKAVERGLLTEEQLREARTFAEGGHSVLAVLLDLGYLKPDALLDLAETRPAPAAQAPPRRRRTLLLAVTLAAVTAAITAWAAQRERVVYVRVPAPAAPAPLEAPPMSTAQELQRRGAALLESAERILPDPGTVLTPEVRSLLERALVLLEESVRDTPNRVSLPLARVREHLRLWKSAAETYARLERSDPSNGEALLGWARVALARSDPTLALSLSERACSLPNPRAEAFLLRGRANLALDRRVEARDDLRKAAELDGSLGTRVRSLLDRKPE